MFGYCSILRPICIICLLAAADGQATRAADDAPRRQLTFAMYPYIPEVDAAAYTIKNEYERLYPEVDLQINLNSDYYGENGVLTDKADVYELDSVFLTDFVTRQQAKLQPLPVALTPLVKQVAGFAQEAATKDGQLYGVPHWLCSNFLI